MRKCIISFIVLLSMSISLAIPAFAAESVEPSKNQPISFTQNIDGQNVEYLLYRSGSVNYVQYTVNGCTRIASYNQINGDLRLDGQVLAVVSPIDTAFFHSIVSHIGIVPYVDEEVEWHHYDTEYGDITSDILTVIDWTSLIIALVSGTLALPTIREAAEDIAKDIVALALPTVYYTRCYYYKTPIVSYRPEIRSSWEFFSDSARTHSIGTIG